MIKNILKRILYSLNCGLTRMFDFRHYWVLSRKLRWPMLSSRSGIQGNYCYGNQLAIKNAMGTEFDSHCMIEHGLYFGRNVLEEECVYPEISTIYTYSPYRLEVLYEHFGENFDKKIIPVGPYIIHANHLLTESKRAVLKEKWGKTLLIFPSHSSPEGDTSFNYDAWLTEIEKRSKNYDTVIVSLYWLDVYNGNYKRYKDKGYILACCGNRFDPNFLSRQKDMISLADMSMSNDIGTHIGYCVSMGVPHCIYHQKVEFEAEKDKDRDTDIISANREREYSGLFSLFSEFKEEITVEQEKAVKYYWGNY